MNIATAAPSITSIGVLGAYFIGLVNQTILIQRKLLLKTALFVSEDKLDKMSLGRARLRLALGGSPERFLSTNPNQNSHS